MDRRYSNFHSHTCYSDGNSDPELYIKAAIENKMPAYGFSCHSPVPFDSDWNMKFENLRNYVEHICRLKEKYKGEIDLFLGLEIDFVKDLTGLYQYDHLKLDYTIGGIHFLGFFADGVPWDMDRSKEWFEKGLNELFDGNIRKLVSFYFSQLSEMILSTKTDVLAHFDLVKKFNRGNLFYDENDNWYRNLCFDTLDLVYKQGIILELNTRGVYQKIQTDFFPSAFILKRCLDLNIPVCLSSDAHSPDEVMALLPEAADLLKSIGFKEVWSLTSNGWQAGGL